MKNFLTSTSKLFLCLAVSLIGYSATAANSSQAPKDDQKVVYQTTFYFQRGHGQWIDSSDYDKADTLVEFAKANPEALINIEGYGDNSGSQEVTVDLSLKRARAINNFLVQNGVDSSRITFEGKGIDYNSSSDKARRAEVVIFVTAQGANQAYDSAEVAAQKAAAAKAAAAQAKVDAEAQAAAQKAEAQKAEAEAAAAQEAAALAAAQAKADAAALAAQEAQAAAAAKAATVQEFTLRTNLLYWLGGLANVGVEWNPNLGHWSGVLNAGFDPFSSSNWKYNLGGWFVSPEIRYYIGQEKQWFVGAQYLLAGVNVRPWDSIYTTCGRKGTLNAGGLLGGYKMALSDSFDMDFTLGLGYGVLNFEAYYDVSGNSFGDFTNKSIMPVQLGVNLIWKL